MPAQLQIKNIHKSYGPQIIFEDATASFSTDQKIGVIGRNGAGKSTLCKIITGQEEMEEGEVCKSSDLRLSYLEQHDAFHLDETVIEFLMRYTGKAEWECGKMAHRFQINNQLLARPIQSLSGGYQTRVKLAAMLLPEPNFLILDEPTNYLDLNTLILLENFLLDFDGGFLIVSHDREFLKRTCVYTLEASNGNLFFYPGSVEEYLTFKEEQKGQIESYNKTVELKKKQLQTFVDRFRANASKAALAQSKKKLIEKLETIEIVHSSGSVRIKIPSVDRRHGVALRCKEMAIGYPEKLVAEGINMEIERGSRIAVLGENGQGKTTFLRTLANDLAPKKGEYIWGSGTKIAYYAQHVLSMLSPESNVYSHLKKNAAQGVTHQDILNIAGSFLFKGDDVEKSISVLSGGEKARLCLAGLLLTKSNVLLLDEPTNHLDFETVEALGNALKKYEGTVFFISHDRTFVNLIATNIVDVKDGRVSRYPGTYQEYVYILEKKAKEEFSGEETQESNSTSHVKSPQGKPAVESGSQSDSGISQESRKTLTYLERKAMKSEVKKLATRIQKLEQQMAFYKNEREGILNQFANDSTSWSRKLSDRVEMLTKLLQEEENTWLKLQEKLDEMNKILGETEG